MPEEKVSAELEKAFTDHYKSKLLVIAERFNFYKRGQAAAESLADYQAAVSYDYRPGPVSFEASRTRPYKIDFSLA